jgi:hypothetical protein
VVANCFRAAHRTSGAPCQITGTTLTAPAVSQKRRAPQRSPPSCNAALKHRLYAASILSCLHFICLPSLIEPWDWAEPRSFLPIRLLPRTYREASPSAIVSRLLSLRPQYVLRFNILTQPIVGLLRRFFDLGFDHHFTFGGQDFLPPQAIALG